ncbi:AMC1 [Linum perenne]
MGSRRRERCPWCGVQLLVPSDSPSFKCSACQAVTDRQAPPPPPVTQSPLRGPPAGGRFSGPPMLNNNNNNNVMMPSNFRPARGPTYPRPGGRMGGYGGGGGRGGGGYINNIDGDQMNYGTGSPPPRMMRAGGPQMGRGRKRALVCGVNYRGKSYGVKGGINDANSMRALLLHNFAFPPDSILMLTEDEGNPMRIPTKANIRKGLRWLVQGCEPGDNLVFHFSGHGSRQKDYDHDELDGFDETLCPLDFETEGMIIDDEINATIAVIDSCYSGTVLDLPFACRFNREGRYMWENMRKSPYAANKNTSGGIAICFSACNDHETSADTNAGNNNISTGALTYSFVKAVQNEPGLSYGHLLNSMRLTIEGASPGGNRPTQVNVTLLCLFFMSRLESRENYITETIACSSSRLEAKARISSLSLSPIERVEF